MRTQLVELRVGDLDYLKDSKRIALEMGTRTTIDKLQKYLVEKDGLNYASKIFISVSAFNTNIGEGLLGIQALVNQGYKLVYKTHNVYNIWTK